MGPMLLKPVAKDFLWGGSRLKTEFNKNSSVTPLAETWECSAHPDGPSTIINGEFSGSTLDVVLKEHPEYLGIKTDTRFGLPVLVKFIDAKRDLSIQVHPDDEFARKNENDFGKTEMWYVLDAEKDASLVYGFAHDISEELLRKAIETGELDKHLNKIRVHKGNVFFIPAGTVHGIGAGCLIAEIAESSNVTYRLYDYNRKDKNGKKRELHIDRALQVLNRKTGINYIQKPRIVQYYPGYIREILCCQHYFKAERIIVRREFKFEVTEDSFQILLCTDGEAQLKVGECTNPMRFKKGDSIFSPAGLGSCLIDGVCEVLRVCK